MYICPAVPVIVYKKTNKQKPKEQIPIQQKPCLWCLLVTSLITVTKYPTEATEGKNCFDLWF